MTTINSKTLLLFFLPCLLQASGHEPHHQTAFIGEPGQSDTLASYSYYTTNHFWNSSGRKLPTFNDFHSHSLFLYSEYALNTCNSVFVQGGYSAVQESLNGNSQGVQDAEFGWKSLICSEGADALTTQITGIIPVGDRKSSVRYGKFGAQFSLLYSNVFCVAEKGGWYDLGLGYRYYQGGPADQIRANAAIGLGLNPYVTLVGSSYLDYGVNNGSRSFNSNNIVNASSYRLITGQIECLITTCNHFYLTVGAFGHFWGRNVGCGGGGFGGFWLVF